MKTYDLMLDNFGQRILQACYEYYRHVTDYLFIDKKLFNEG